MEYRRLTAEEKRAIELQTVLNAAPRHATQKRTLYVLIAVFVVFMVLLFTALRLCPYDGSEMDIAAIQSPPSAGHWLGTNRLGQDLYAQLLRGIVLSLIIAFCSAILSAALGTAYGLVSGYLGGTADLILCRGIEVVKSVPSILWVFVMSAVFQKGIVTMILVLGFCAWSTTAILVRSAAFEIRERDYIKAAFCLGASSGRIEFSHILPNCMPLVLVQIVMMIPNSIFAETMLSYVGMGIEYPMVSFGTMLKQAVSAIYVAPYQLWACSITMIVILFYFYALGETLKGVLGDA